MRSNRSNLTAAHHGEEGVSPVISTILMICLTVIIVMIVATLILSEPLPDEIPHAAIFARNESGNFTLAHMAGDHLKEGAYRIYVDTINGLVDETANFTGLKDGIWSAGEILTYNGMEELERVVITAISGGTEVILAELGPGGRSRGTTPTETLTPTPTPTPTPTDPPDVDFTANIIEGNAPLTVQFTDESAGDVTSWHWIFGDGSTSAEQNPIHTYITAGTYSVTLTATGPGGSDACTRPDYITVLGPPQAAFTADPTGGNAPLTVQFTDESTGDVTSWHWVFGDGSTSTEQSPTHTYVTAGTYSVTLTATGPGGSDTMTKTGYITVLGPPEANFIADPTEGNAPLTVQFTDQSTGDVTSWHWVFGDGSTSTDQNPSHTYMTVGTYTISLTVSNAYGTDSKTRVAYIDVARAQLYEPEPDLEDELGNWATSGVGGVRAIVDHPVYGDVVEITSTENDADYSMSRDLSTKGYENIIVSFHLAAVGFNNPGDILVVEWFDGASWYELLRIAGDKDPYADGEFYEFSYTLPPSANDNPSFAIRFKLTHHGKAEYVYVDLKNLQITGDPISPS